MRGPAFANFRRTGTGSPLHTTRAGLGSSFMKRQRRNRNKGGGGNSNNPNRSFDSNGPEVRVRGNANTVYEKYVQLAQDANRNGNRVRAEALYQHAEHYLRVHTEQQAARDAATKEKEAREAKRREERDARNENRGNRDKDGDDGGSRRSRGRNRRDDHDDASESGGGDAGMTADPVTAPAAEAAPETADAEASGLEVVRPRRRAARRDDVESPDEESGSPRRRRAPRRRSAEAAE